VRTSLAALAALVLAVAVACGTEPDAGPGTGAASDTTGVPETVTTATDPPPEGAPKLYSIARVVDGDTIVLRNGTRVRLLQIDAPEPSRDECFGREATAMLSAVLPKGTKVRLVADPNLDDVDSYDRLLRYVFKAKRNVNVLLVKRGGASVWYVRGAKGTYASRLLRVAKNAKKAGRGLWGACPGTKLDPTSAIATDPTPPAPPPADEPPPAPPDEPSGCHPSYVGECLDPSASDYDCRGGEGNGPEYTGPVRVVGPDEYDLDRDRDGLGCEDS
jgi:endonuclease YncB( thermonuclease family)